MLKKRRGFISILFDDLHVPVMDDDVFRIVQAALYGEAVAAIANLNDCGGFLIGLVEELEHFFVLLVSFWLYYNTIGAACQHKNFNRSYYFY